MDPLARLVKVLSGTAIAGVVSVGLLYMKLIDFGVLLFITMVLLVLCIILILVYVIDPIVAELDAEIPTDEPLKD